MIVDQLIPATPGPGTIVYALLTAPDGTVWDAVAGALVAINTTTRARRAFVLPEQQTGEGQYLFTFPAVPSNARPYFVTVWIQSGGSPAVSDSEVANLQFLWNGSQVLSLSYFNNTGQTTPVPTGASTFSFEVEGDSLSVTDVQ